MTVEIGQVLDKYELLEEVGQGGMAVVYRGLDRSLRREVAVKILHRHLADNAESRERFQREARAVAKLHHTNILEIFDFSGLDSKESYIVTEFIDGQTLAAFIRDYDITFPEVGALLVAEVCQALRHAHGHGVLHRDIKPENIMVRSDGVLKLMDFGIAQVIDSQRMTVTGQLLGSPAYMSPEHILGKPLDFRTDVFSMGILLYQLCTSELPFQGQNAHEILNRIADCKYPAPDRRNPLVGASLRRIIDTAMAREKADRYRDVGQLHEALVDYLSQSGLEDTSGEAARFFGAPASYEMALKQRLVETLTRAGTAKLRTDAPAALEILNRVATMDPDNAEVTAALRKLERRQRGRSALVYLAVAIAVVGIALGARSMWPSPPAAPLAAAPSDGGALDAGAIPDATRLAMANSADAAATIASADAAPLPDARRRTTVTRPVRRPPPRIDAGVAASVTLRVFPPNSQYKLGDGPWTTIAGRSTTVPLSSDAVAVQLRNDECCQSVSRTLRADGPTTVSLSLPYLPSALTPVCANPNVSVQIDGRVARVGEARTITFGDSLSGQRSVRVVFLDNVARRTDAKTVPVRFNERREVRCKL